MILMWQGPRLGQAEVTGRIPLVPLLFSLLNGRGVLLLPACTTRCFLKHPRKTSNLMAAKWALTSAPPGDAPSAVVARG